jgi:hypothetical protein
MRGEEQRQRAMLVVINPEKRVPKDHPIRRIKQLADEHACLRPAGNGLIVSFTCPFVVAPHIHSPR